jgi:predicted dehydrogenase
MRAAIIGTGGIARIHATLIGQLGGQILGVSGRTIEAATAFGVGTPYEDALEGGAHVLCEKPMATSTEECLRMIDAARRANRIGAIAYTYRGYPLVEVLRAKVAEGAFGKLRRLGGCYLSQDVLPADKYVWLFTPGTTGRSYALMDLGVHWLDMAEYVSGQRIVDITAQFSTHQAERIWRGGAGEGPRPPGKASGGDSVIVASNLEEQADLLVRFSGGAAGCMTVSGVSPGHPNTIILSADGPESGFDWNQQEPNIYVERSAAGNAILQRSPDMLPADRAWMSRLPAGHAEGYLDAFRNVVSQAWSAMRGESAAFPSFADGLRGIQLIEAAVRSADTRQTIRL